MKLENWSHKDIWKQHGKYFLIEVSRHTVESNEKGPHRWCVYAYLYPPHPHFAAFDGDSLSQWACEEMPLHGGPFLAASLLRYYHDRKGVTSVQVGADYNHLHDDRFTYYGTPELAREVFNDAEQLFDWLTNYHAAQPSDA